MTTVVFWLMISAGDIRTPPVFLPEPFSSKEDCRTAGETFKESPLDTLERGSFVCLPQTAETK